MIEPTQHFLDIARAPCVFKDMLANFDDWFTDEKQLKEFAKQLDLFTWSLTPLKDNVFISQTGVELVCDTKGEWGLKNTNPGDLDEPFVHASLGSLMQPTVDGFSKEVNKTILEEIDTVLLPPYLTKICGWSNAIVSRCLEYGTDRSSNLLSAAGLHAGRKTIHHASRVLVDFLHTAPKDAYCLLGNIDFTRHNMLHETTAQAQALLTVFTLND